jgi:3-hydroxyisobutyrate dehydrogenase
VSTRGSDGANARMKCVGFVGVGNMGWPMAANLLKSGFAVAVADARREVAHNFVQQLGGTAPDTLAQLAAQSDVVVTMLPTSSHVASVLAESDDHLLAGLKPGSIVIDMTSGQPAVTQELARKVAEAGAVLIDAPVSGGVPRAKTGQLAIMVGGPEAAIERARPVLAAMGTTVTRCGDVGAGQAMKALNNLVSAGGFLIGIEALLIGQKFGLDPALMTDVLNASTGMNNSTQKKFRQFVLSRGFDSGFSLELMVKDLSIALEIARDGAVPAPFAAQCRELWASAVQLLGPGQDHTALAKLPEALAGMELKGRS